MGDSGDIPAKKLAKPNGAESSAQDKDKVDSAETKRAAETDVQAPNGVLGKQALSEERQAAATQARQAEASTKDHIPGVEIVDGKAADSVSIFAIPKDDELMIPVSGTDAPIRWTAAHADLDQSTYNRLSSKVDSLIQALTPHNGFDSQTNRETVFSVLKDMSESDRKLVSLLYEQKRQHRDLDGDIGIKADLKIAEITRGDRDRITSLLQFGKDDDASRLHADLVDMSQMVTGPGLKSSERDIRDTLATLNSKELAGLQQEYKTRYGEDLKGALRGNTKISSSTRYFLDIAFRGSDKRTDDDRKNIAEVAAENKDIELFKEAMRGSSQKFRDQFKAEGGLEKIKSFEGKDYEQAKEYAESGFVSTASVIRDNTWIDEKTAFGMPAGIVNLIGMGNNKQAIETQLSNLTNKERQLYEEGRRIAKGILQSEISKNTIDSASAIKCYNEIQSALSKAGSSDDLKHWEKIIAGTASQLQETATVPHPEEALREFIQGKGPPRADMETIVNSLSPDGKEKLKADYLAKYGSDVIGDLSLNRESASNKTLREMLQRGPADQREAFHRSQDDMLTSYEGIGKHVTNAFSATGRQADNAYQKFAEAIATSSGSAKEIPAERLKKLTNECGESLRLFREAKKATAQGLADVAITAGSLAAAIPSGSTSLSLLAFTTGTAATAKVAIKSAVQGNDYDRSKLVNDAISGGLEGATATLGTEHIAKVLSLGSRTATNVARHTVMSVSHDALKEGAEKTIGKELNKMISYAIGNGTMQIGDHELASLAAKVATSGNQKHVEQMLKHCLQNGMEMQCKNELARALTKCGLNAAAGAAGGAIAAEYSAEREVDPRASKEDQLAQITKARLTSAFLGGLTGGAFTAGTEALRGSVAKIGQIRRTLSEQPRYIHNPGIGIPADTHSFHYVSHLNVKPVKTNRETKFHDDQGNVLFSSNYLHECHAVQDAVNGGIDLRRANFSHLNLDGINWGNTDLTGANFAGASLMASDFSGVHCLEGADFSGAQLHDANFSNKQLANVNFSRANLDSAVLDGARVERSTNFTEADLTYAQIKNLINLEQSTLRGVTLQNQDLTHLKLAGVDLEGSDLSCAKLSGIDLTGTNLKDANAFGALFDKANLSQAIIDGVNFDYAKFNYADLSGQDLTQIRLRNAPLWFAKLHDVNLKGIDFADKKIAMDGADLTGANLEGAQNLPVFDINYTGANLRGVHFGELTALSPRTNFTGADLRDTNLSEVANLHLVNMENANLQGLDLKGAHLSQAKLAGANLEGANLEDSILHGADLKDAVLRNANLRQAQLTKANLQGSADLGEPDEWGRPIAERRSTNLEGADFTDATLANANLEGHAFSGTSFKDADLTYSNLRHSDFTNTDLTGTTLLGADLKAADLEDVDLSFKDLGDADLSEANLAMSNLQGVKLTTATLDNADLQDADLRGAVITDTAFDGANASGANFEESEIKGMLISSKESNFSNANFGNAKIEKSYFNDCNLTAANFSNARIDGLHFGRVNLENSNFRDADLKGSTFSHSQLNGATLQGANCTRSKFNNIDLTKANIRGVDFTDAVLSSTNFTSQDLRSVILKNSSICDSTMRETNLAGLDVGKAIIDGCDFTHAKLQDTIFSHPYLDLRDVSFAGADLSRSKFDSFVSCGTNTDFSNADLSGMRIRDSRNIKQANFENANLVGFTFPEKDLEGIRLQGANLQGTNLDDANLSKTNLKDCNLKNASVRNADLTGANLEGRTDLGEPDEWGRDISERRSTNLEGTDFTGANLEGANLEGHSFNRTNLKDANLSRADLRHGDFTNTDLSGATLQGANLRAADFEDVTLSEQDLSHADFSEANLVMSNLQGANLQHSTMIDAELRDVNLEGANLSYAHLNGANFDGCNLRRANFERADLSNSELRTTFLRNHDLTGTNLEHAILSYAHLSDSDLSKSFLKSANFDWSDLSGANFSGQDLTSVTLTNSDLSYANLSQSNLERVDFTGVKLHEANLSDANLQGAVKLSVRDVNYEGANLRGAVFDPSATATEQTNFSRADLRDIYLYDVNQLKLANFEGAVLDGQELLGVDLTNARLAGASLEGAQMDQVKLNGANLKGANLKNAIVRGASLRYANLEGHADLGEPDLWGRELKDRRSTNLEGADFSTSDLHGANLEGHCFNNTNLFWADLTNSNMRYADLTNANLDRVKLSGADLKGADLEDKDLSKKDLTDIDFSEANLVMSNLSSSYLKRTNFANADLRDTNLNGVDLSGAYLTGADCSNSDLTGAKLINTDITEVKFNDAKKDFSLLEDRPSAPTLEEERKP